MISGIKFCLHGLLDCIFSNRLYSEPLPSIIILKLGLVVYNKENLERQETDKYGRGTVRHLPKTDESVVRPAGERH